MKKRALRLMLIGSSASCGRQANEPSTTGWRTRPAARVVGSRVENQPQSVESIPPLHTLLPQCMSAKEPLQQRLRLLAIKQVVARAERSARTAHQAMSAVARQLKPEDPCAAAIAALGDISSSPAFRDDAEDRAEHPLLAHQSAIAPLVASVEDPVEVVREITPLELGRIVERSPELAWERRGDSLSLWWPSPGKGEYARLVVFRSPSLPVISPTR